MRKTMLLLGLVLPLAATATERQDTTVVYEGQRIVINTDSAETHVSVYRPNGHEMEKKSETVFDNGQEIERVYVTSPFLPSSYKGLPVGTAQPTVWYGWRLMTNRALGQLGRTEGLHTRDGGSFEVGLTGAEICVPLDRQQEFTLSAAIQSAYVRQNFQKNALPTSEGHRIGFSDITATPADKNYVDYVALRLPVQVLLAVGNASARRHYRLQLGLGAQVEYRGGLRHHYMPGAFGDPVNNSHLKMNRVGLALTGSISYGPFKLIATDELTPLFSTVGGKRGYAITTGIGVNVFELIKKK